MDKEKEDLQLCTACLRDDEKVEALHWCCDCTETLCDTCGKVHKRSRFSTNHKLIRLQDVNNSQSFLLTTSFLCDVHSGMKMAFYCNNHDQLLCEICLLQTHKDCKNISPIYQISSQGHCTTKYNDDFDVLHRQSSKFTEMLDKIISEKKENLKVLNLQKDRIEDSIKKMRAEIEEHLSNLEKELMTSLTLKHESCLQQIEEEISELLRHKQQMDIPKNDIQLMEKYASDPYKFMVTKLFDVKKTKTDDIIADFNDTNKTLELEFSTNGSQLYTSLGWIDIKVLPTNEATISMNNTSKSHDNHQLILAKKMASRPFSSPANIRHKGKSTTMDSNIRELQVQSNNALVSYTNFQTATTLGEHISISRGCFIPQKHILLCDSTNGYIYKINLHGTFVSKIPLIYTPLDVALFDKTKAVICAGDRGIQIVKLKNGECIPEMFIKPGGKCKAMSCVGNQIIVRNGHCKISILDIHGNSVLKINTKYDPFFISADIYGSIFWTSNNTDEVQCIATKRAQYVYTSNNLIGPTGLAVDGKGHAFVAGYESGNVHRISIKGDKTVVLNEGIYHPWHLAFDKELQKLMIISNDGTTIHIYTYSD